MFDIIGGIGNYVDFAVSGYLTVIQHGITVWRLKAVSIELVVFDSFTVNTLEIESIV